MASSRRPLSCTSKSASSDQPSSSGTSVAERTSMPSARTAVAVSPRNSAAKRAKRLVLIRVKSCPMGVARASENSDLPDICCAHATSEAPNLTLLLFSSTCQSGKRGLAGIRAAADEVPGGHSASTRALDFEQPQRPLAARDHDVGAAGKPDARAAFAGYRLGVPYLDGQAGQLRLGAGRRGEGADEAVDLDRRPGPIDARLALAHLGGI